MAQANEAAVSLPSAPRDAYADLLRDTRGLHGEQQAAREAWYARLPWDYKEDLLFELEIMLKGLVCFSNPRNHPGPVRKTPVVAIDFREHLACFRDGLARVIALARQMLGPRDRAFVFHRYLETVLPEDMLRSRLAREGLSRETPEEALISLRHALTHLLEVVDGSLRLQRVPFRHFYAVGAIAQREIAQSAYFNPLFSLEFRPELDRIRSREVLDLISRVPSEQGHRLVALTFLSLFRMLRYLRLIERIASDSANDDRRKPPGRAYLVLAVLRSDARALASHLRQRSGELLAEGFERELLSTPAEQLRDRHQALITDGHKLTSIKSALEGIAANLRLEMLRIFERELPPPDSGIGVAELEAALRDAVFELRPALENAVLYLGKTLDAKLDESGVLDGRGAKRDTSERLRRDVWMFAQVVRAFVAKARHARDDDCWNAAAGFAFVSEFLIYFRTMGLPLLRASDYPRVDAFISAMSAIRDVDLLEPAKLDEALAESEAFFVYLLHLFEQISKRDELAGVPFDKRRAAEALKMYLGGGVRGARPPK